MYSIRVLSTESPDNIELHVLYSACFTVFEIGIFYHYNHLQLICLWNPNNFAYSACNISKNQVKP